MEKKKFGFGKFMMIGVLAAAVAALVAVWKASKPIEDPWRMPAPSTEPQSPVAKSTEAETEDIRKLASE